MPVSSNSVVRNSLWRFAEVSSARFVMFFVSIILGRLLLPEDYGVVGIVAVFVAILKVFVESGFGQALIQKKDSDDLDFSTVFYFNLVLCAVLYALLFMAAPFIASFYNIPTLRPVLRVLGLTIILSAFGSVAQAHIAKSLQFKKFFWATLTGTIASCSVGLILAFKGYGVWALVWQDVVKTLLDTVVMWIVVSWKPSLMFSFKRLKVLFGFGSKILLTSLFDKIFNNIRQLIIGKVYSEKDLGYYNKGEKVPNFFTVIMDTTINSVLFSVMSKDQDDRDRVMLMTKVSTGLCAFVLMPIMGFLIIVAEPLVVFLLTEKWLPCVPYLRTFCLIYLTQLLVSTNLNSLKAIGRSDIFLYVDITSKTINILTLFITVNKGPLLIALGVCLSTILTYIICIVVNAKFIQFGILEHVSSILPSFLITIVTCVCVYFLGGIGLAGFPLMIVQGVFGFVLYLGLSKLFRITYLDILVEQAKIIIRGKKC